MTHFFDKRDRWGNGNALWVVGLMVFVAPLAFWALKQIHLKNDIETWLPHEDPHRQLLSWYTDQFHREDRVLISWEGSTLHDPRLARFSRKLEGVEDGHGIRRDGLKQVRSVATPPDMIARMGRHGVDPAEAIERLQGVLIGTGPLKVRLTNIGRTRRRSTLFALTDQVRSRLGLDIEILDPVEEWEPPDGFFKDEPLVTESAPDTGTDTASDEVVLPPLPPHDFQVLWSGMRPGAPATQDVIELVKSLRGEVTADEPEGIRLVEDCFFASGSPVGISVTLSEAGIADVSGTIRAIRQVAEEVGIPPDTLHMGGRPVARSTLNHEVLSAAWNPDAPLYQLQNRSVVLLSGLVGTVLVFLLLRNIRLTLLILVVTYYTTFVTVAIVPVTGGSMNMVLVVMPTLLMVLTISASIHLANYWKHAAILNKKTAVVEATKMARLPCTMAAVTTAIGLLSLLTSTLRPVRDFGLYSAIGCLVALVMVLFGLPALIQICPLRSPDTADADRTGWRVLGTWIARAKVPIISATVLFFLVSCYGFKWFRTETKGIRYFPESSPIVQDYRFLEHNLANIIPVEMLVCFDKSEQERLNFLERMEVVRHIEEGVRQHPEISGAISLADFLETYKPVSKSASRMQKLLATRKANEVEKRVKEGKETGAASFLTLATASVNFPFEEGRDFKIRKGNEIWRITAQTAIMSDYDYGHLTNDRQTGELDEIAKTSLKYHPGASHVVTGMVPLFLRTQKAVLKSLIVSFALAFGVIALVMIVILRSPTAGLLAMVPNVMPVGVVFGLLSWAGKPVDIGTMITASVALGIAVDGTLHLMTWFRKGIACGLSRDEAVAETLSHCGPALWQTSLAIGVGMLMLCPAELLLVSRFGWLMAALIGTAFVADAVLLSALLAGPLGLVLERAMQSGSADVESMHASKSTSLASAEVPATGPHFFASSPPAERPLQAD